MAKKGTWQFLGACSTIGALLKLNSANRFADQQGFENAGWQKYFDRRLRQKWALKMN
jgi:hypothetical protein